MCNKNGGAWVQKKLGILHLKNGAGYANEKPTPPLLIINPITFDIINALYVGSVISKKQPNITNNQT